MVLERLPDNISEHLPNGDPYENRQEIRSVVEQMIVVGPKGYEVKHKYLNGTISYNEFDTQLDEIANKVNRAELRKLESNLKTIEEEVTSRSWRGFFPLVDGGIRVPKLIEAVKNLQDIEPYQSEEQIAGRQKQKVTAS
jgi:hypothetical protein